MTRGWRELQWPEHRTVGCREGSSTWKQNGDTEGGSGLTCARLETAACSATKASGNVAVRTVPTFPGAPSRCLLGIQVFLRLGGSSWDGPRSQAQESHKERNCRLPAPPPAPQPHAVHTPANPTVCPERAGSAAAAAAPPTGAPCPEANPLGTRLAGRPRHSLS